MRRFPARNFAVRHASGEFLVFADAHIQLPEGWWQPMLQLLGQPSAGAVASVVSDITEPDRRGHGMRFRPDLTMEWLPLRQRSAYPVALIPWCCAAMRRDVFDKSGGLDEGMIRWGAVDLEYSLIFHLFPAGSSIPRGVELGDS